MNFYEELGKNLRIARDMKGLSLHKLAAQLDISYQQLQKYESGTNRIPLDKLMSLCEVCDFSMMQILSFNYPHLNAAHDEDKKDNSSAYKANLETLEIVKVFPTLPDHVRYSVLKLLKALSDKSS